MKKLEKEEKELDMGISSKTTEEKEEYQLYAWNKKKEKCSSGQTTTETESL